MGIYVNPGNSAFKEAINSMIYVDKTSLISFTNQVLNTKQKNICVSRPRRFGKSMAADMLAAYYSKGCDSGQLFAGRKIEGEETFQIHLNQHNVIRLDIQRFLFDESHLDIFINKIQEAVIKDLETEYSGCFTTDQYGLPGVLEQIYARTKKGFIFIIDEWDCVFRIAKEYKEAQKQYLDFLRGIFKGADYVELAYMTGILPIKKYGEHSAINIFDEYSMIDPAELSEFFGFTQEEVYALCVERNIDFLELQKWYDGYLLNETHIYNPKSVVDVMRRRRFKGYWTGTETYEALKVYIDMDFDGLKEAVVVMLGNGRYKINTRKFQNDMTTFASKDDVMTLLVHLGYLTYDEMTEEVLIPNQELMKEFFNVVDEPGWDGVIQSLRRSEELLKSTWEMNEEKVAEGIGAIHSVMD